MLKWVFVLLCVLFLRSVCYCAAEDDALTNGWALARAGNTVGAASLVEQAVARASADGAEWLRGYAQIWRGDRRAALQRFQALVDTYPQSSHKPDALLNVGHLRDVLGEDSRADFERLAREHANTKEAGEASHYLGHQALRHGDPAAAIKWFKDSANNAQTKPETAAESQVEASYASISLYWKSPDKAALRDALQTFPKPRVVTASDTSASIDREIRIRLGRGEIFLIQGLGEQAAAEYQSVLDLRPTDPYLRGIAQYELGCALYSKRDWAGAVTAFGTFLDGRSGETLVQKDSTWKQARPGYSAYALTDPTKAAALSGLELVPTAAYWKAASLVELKQYAAARQLLSGLSAFPKAKIGSKVTKMNKLCAYMLGEGSR